MFDAYHKWLGIPKHQRPPTFYQLLGIAPDEKDVEVIKEAAIRQTTHIRAYQVGPHAAECTRILNEIAQARQTLLNAAKRKEYDQKLAQEAPQPAAHAVTAEPPADQRPARKVQYSKEEPRSGAPEWLQNDEAEPRAGLPPWLVPAAFGGGAVVLALMGAAIFFLLPSSPAPRPPVAEVIKQKAAEPEVEPVKPAPVKPAPVEPEPPPPVVLPPVLPDGGAPMPVTLPAGQVLAAEVVREATRIDDVSQAILSRDGSRILSADEASNLVLRGSTAQTWDQEQRLPLDQPRVQCLALSGDNRTALLATGRVGPAAKGLPRAFVLDTARPGAKSVVYAGHDTAIWSGDFSPDGRWVVTGGGGPAVREGAVPGETKSAVHVWDATSGAELKRWEWNERMAIVRVAFAADGTRAYAVMMNGKVFELDPRSGEEKLLHAETNGLVSPAFSPDRRHLVYLHTGSFQVKHFRLAPFQAGATFPLPREGPINQLAISADNRQVIVAGDGRESDPMSGGLRLVPWLRFHELVSGRLLGVTRPDKGQIRSLCTCAGSADLLTVDAFHRLRLWRITAQAGTLPTEPTPVAVVPTPTPPPTPAPLGKVVRPVESVLLQLGGYPVVQPTRQPDRLLLAGNDLKLYEFGKQDLRRFGPAKVGPARAAIALSPDGSRFYVAYTDNAINMYDFLGQTSAQFGGHDVGKAVTGLALTPDGRLLVSTGLDRTVRLWDTTTAKPIDTLNGHTAAVQAVGISPDGRRAVTSSNKELILWDLENRRLLLTTNSFRDADRVAFALDGKIIAHDRVQGELGVLDGQTLAVQMRYKEGERTGPFVFTPSGKYLLAYDKESGAVQMWEYPAMRVVRTYEGTAKGLTACGVAPDGRFFYALGDDNMLHKYPLNDAPALVVATTPAPDVKTPPPVTTPMPETKMPAGPVVRVKVPDEDKVKEAEKAVFDLLKAEYAAAKKGGADKVALVEKLLQLAADTKDDAIARYALLGEARTHAIQAGRVPLALQAVDEMGRQYEIDPLEAKQAALAALMKSPALNQAGARELTDTALAAVGESIATDKVSIAPQFLSLAEAGAKKAGSAALSAQVGKHDKEVKQIAKEFEQMQAARQRLKKDPDDAEANLQAGKYLALRKGDWEQGLPLLAKVKEGALSEVARKDLTAPQDAKERRDLGDDWWTIAEKETGWLKYSLQARAVFWYRQALPGLSGLTQARALERVKAAEEQPAPLQLSDNLAEVRHLAKAHTSAIMCLSVSPDGKNLYSGGADGQFRTWTVSTLKHVLTLQMLVPIASFSVSPQQQYLAICSQDSLRVWDLRKGTWTNKNNAYPEGVPGAYWTGPDTVLGLARNGRCDVRTFGPTGNFQSGTGGNPYRGTVKGMACSPDHRMLVIFGDDGESLYETLTFPIPRGNLANLKATAAAFSHDNKLVALAAADQAIHLYDVGTKSEVKALPAAHTGSIRCMVFVPGNQRLLTAGDDKTVRLWDLSTGRELRRFALHTGSVLALAVTPDSRYAFSAGTDLTIRQWALPAETK